MTPTPVMVTVESLGGLGDGIASYNGKPLFIPKSCAGDRLEVRIVHENHNGLQGVIERIISPGPERRDAPCPYFDRCGGCSLQQLVPVAYREFKTRMLHSALARAGFPSPDAQVVFLPAATRRRVEFKVSHEAGNIALSFHAPRSHTAIAIDQCLVLRPELQAMIAPVNRALSSYKAAKYLYAVSLTAADSGIDMLLTFKGCDIASLPPLDRIASELNLARICVRIAETQPIVAVQSTSVDMQLGDFLVPLPPDAFLQATREGQEQLTTAALKAAEGATSVIDLFCGIGTYSFPLSAQSAVHAIEGEAVMVAAIQKAAQKYGIRSLTAEARDLFKHPFTVQELARFDAAVINPPRTGAKAQTEALAQSAISSVAMISCNPATFARDAQILAAGGFSLVSAQGIDQFVWNQHLEIAALFRRS